MEATAMTLTIEAIYENGVLTPALPLPQPGTDSVRAGPGQALRDETPAAKGEPAPEKKGAKVKQPATAPAEAAAAGHRAIPANGEELQRRLKDCDERLAKQGKCKPGELLKHIVAAGVKAGYSKDLGTWNGLAIQLAIDEAKTFEKMCSARAESTQPEPRRKEVA